MTELRAPIKKHVEDDVAEADAQRLWMGIVDRRARRHARRRARPLLVLAYAAFAATALWLWLGRGSAEHTLRPLETAQGGPPRFRSDERAARTELDDGSRVELEPRTELDILNNDGRAFVTVLRRGTATFDVRPGGERRWTIETGLGSVEVLGTRFTIRKTERAVRVEVARGVVLVRAQSLPERARRLGAGEQVVLTAEGAAAPATSVTASPSAEVEAPVASRDSDPASDSGARHPVRAPAPAPSTAAVTASSFDELLRQADAARAAGDRDGAIAALRRALRDPAQDARRATAAFSLGKLLLETGRPAEAADAFATCLRLSPPAALAEDALVRSIEAEARAGRLDRARALASDYERRYPLGRRRGEVQRWLEPAP